MLALRADTKTGGRVLALVLQPENLKRIEAGDPVTLNLGEYFDGMTLEIMVGAIPEGFRAESAMDILQYIGRGFTKTADDGHAPILIEKGKN